MTAIETTSVKYDYVFIEGTLELQSGLHIGSGQMADDTDAAVIKDAQGRPYIPGSSLKGVMRTLSEQFHHLVIDQPRVPVCFLADSDCNKGEKADQLRAQIEQLIQQQRESEINELIDEHVCPVCQLYGSQFRASKLVVADSYLQETEGNTTSENKNTTIRHSVAIDRDTGTAKDGAKYDYEVANRGLRFSFHLEGKQLSKQDEKLLFIALLHFVSGRVQLGGNISRGLGAVKLEKVSLYTYSFAQPEGKKAYINFLLTGRHQNGKTFEEWKDEIIKKIQGGQNE
ncbi:CRISPR-associated RAMP protein Csx7 [Geobacillus sp. C56-T2]|uniref:type III CRISPR-associated RAMP protein Csx7 n=1 Tax=Geobacillus sp. C56-T2 TaxID=600773 RepID=UPI0011A9A83E|nr:CRISPR-associated RAMP protein Csx7 [Geobacillus sp. C56-T2]NNV06829.1 CRISPR-associated RAMP protein [Geobacillus sp. MMMUD3]TWG30823.1 CRISPR-associated RAMP protein (TIGR02581 family) [Geobacillus sp. C56-T2]